MLEKYVHNTLKYDMFDYSYESSEYEKLVGKKYQLFAIYDDEMHIPFISLSEGTSIAKDAIYVRRDTSSILINKEELDSLIERRITSEKANNSRLELEEHLQQLKTLYVFKGTKKPIPYFNIFKVLIPFGSYNTIEYDEYINELIDKKKKRLIKSWI